MKYSPKFIRQPDNQVLSLQKGYILPTLPTFTNLQSTQDNAKMQYAPEDILKKEEQIARGAKIRLAEREKALRDHYNRTDLIGGMKNKPTPEQIKYQAQKSVEYNDKLRNDPVGTLGPDIALSLIPELLMFKGPSQAIGKGLNYINPFKSTTPWQPSIYNNLKTTINSNVDNLAGKSPIFMHTSNSMTRGIGKGNEGLMDLFESGIVRANPRGRLTNPSDFRKYSHTLEIEGFNKSEIEEIASNNLSKNTFNKLKTLESRLYPKVEETGSFNLKRKGILEGFDNYNTYKNQPKLGSYEDAYWYESGKLPNYFNYPSDYFVRARNISKYEPYIPLGHYHPTTKTPLYLENPDLDVFKTIKLPIINKKIGIKISKPGFKSKINWSQWNEEIPNNIPLLKEYNAIEESTKKSGSWMKNSDGSKFEGIPEQFIQMKSKNAAAFAGNSELAEQMYKNKLYRGSHQHIADIKNRDRNDYALFTTNNRNNAIAYGHEGNGRIFRPEDPQWSGDGLYELGIPQNLPIVVGNGGGNNSWRLLDWDERIANGTTIIKQYGRPDISRAELHLEELANMAKSNKLNPNDYKISKFDPSKKYLSTDVYANYVKNTNNPEAIARIDDVVDTMGDRHLTPTTVYAIDADRVPIKSLMYNNGMFDITNPNIYKSLFPIGLSIPFLNKNKK